MRKRNLQMDPAIKAIHLDPALRSVGRFAPTQEQLRQLVPNRTRKAQAANLCVCRVVVVAELTESIEAGIGLVVQKSYEVWFAYEINLAILKHFGGCLVRRIAD